MLEVKNLCYKYDAKSKNPITALENINFSLKSGETLGIIGKTGSGKSTLVQLLSGLIPVTHGKILLDENDISSYPSNIPICFKIGLSFQYPETQLFGKTVFEDIAFGPRNKGIEESKINSLVQEAAEFTGLDKKLLDRSPLELSGGEKRKSAIAGIIAMKPEILILDEPTSGLDPQSKNNLLNSIIKYQKKENNIVIIVSHVMEEIAEACQKTLVLNEGRQIFYDKTENVFKNYTQLKKIGLDVPCFKKVIYDINKNLAKFPKKQKLNENINTLQKTKEEIFNFLST